MPAGEAWQLGLGLAIPLLLIPHAGGVRIGSSAYGMDGGFDRVIYQFWVASPDFALPRQLLLLLVVWVHGCIGVRAWLASKPWYRRASAPLASLATLVPVVALLGFISAGLDLRDAVHRDPSLAQHYAPAAAGSAAAQSAAALDWIVNGLVVAYLALVAGVFALRAARDWHAKRFRALRITYPDQRVVVVPVGFSVLEASRWAEIPHESICGGRGRCSTCRISVVAGAEWLAPANPNERRTLDRIRARPMSAWPARSVPPATCRSCCSFPLRPGPRPRRRASTPRSRAEWSAEIAAMFVDLRESTRLATERLPYDALFLFDRYIQVVTGAVRKHSGHVTSVAGDGVMSVFGVHGNAASAARDAFRAAHDLWSGLGALNKELAAELGAPLRIGIGLHVGVSVVGLIATRGSQSLQFLGDTGNIAGKLEQQTKQLDCTMVASVAALNLLSPGAGIGGKAIPIPGKEEPIDVVTFHDVRDLERLLASAPLV